MKSKILITFSLVLLILLSLTVNCFAVSDYPSIKSISTIDGLYINYFIFTKNNDVRAVVISTDNSSAFSKVTINYNSWNTRFNIWNSSDEDLNMYYFILNNGEWETFSASSIVSAGTKAIVSISDSVVVESTVDIYKSYNSSNDGSIDEIFFQKTPVPSTLVEVLEMSKPKEMFQTMIRGIIPYLIALVVGLVAFWKAWQILLKELRKA